MDPTIHNPKKISTKARLNLIFEKIVRAFWIIIIIFVVAQTGLILTKIFSKQPHERMCWDETICFNYCELAKQKRCVIPENKGTLTAQQSWELLLTGKRNIIEILNDGQKYCACAIESKEETNLETFYRYYFENK
ncbi:MAG: hypothetical protein WCV50_00755 [Patescibacteria group bacterium]|jgi:hypothetical protein